MPELSKCEFTFYIFLPSFSHLLLFSAVLLKNVLLFFCHTLSTLLVYIFNFLPNIANFLSLLLCVNRTHIQFMSTFSLKYMHFFLTSNSFVLTFELVETKNNVLLIYLI